MMNYKPITIILEQANQELYSFLKIAVYRKYINYKYLVHINKNFVSYVLLILILHMFLSFYKSLIYQNINRRSKLMRIIA